MKPSLTGPAQTRSEREPGQHTETAAQSNAGAGYRQSRASRGSATGIRKRRRSATSLGVRGSSGAHLLHHEGMGNGQARSRSVLMALDNHTRLANRTNLNRAMSLAKARPCRGSPWTTSPATGRTSTWPWRCSTTPSPPRSEADPDDRGRSGPGGSPGAGRTGCLATTPDGQWSGPSSCRRAAPRRWWAVTMGEPGLGEGLVDGAWVRTRSSCSSVTDLGEQLL